MVENLPRSKFDVVMSNLASMDYMTTFTIRTFQERLASVGVHICRSTLYNYMDYVFQAEQGVQKLKTQGEKRLYYQIIGDIPLDLSTTSLRKQARKKYKERGWLKAVKISVTPTDEINYSDEKKKQVANYRSTSLPRKRVAGGGPREGVGQQGSIFQTMYRILLNMEIGSTFAHKDLKSILMSMGLEIKSSILNTYLSSLYRADAGVDRVRVYDGRRVQSYYTLTAELPKNVTITFFRKLAEGCTRITEAVIEHPGTSIEFKDPEMKEIWLSINQGQVQPTVVSEEKVKAGAHSVMDQPYTEAELGRMLVEYIAELEANATEFEEKIRELEKVPDLRDKVAALRTEVSRLKIDLEIKDNRISQLSSELKEAGRTKRLSIRERISGRVNRS